jgi:ferric-dicitrate binding protein FerR (iron transport regulator)
MTDSPLSPEEIRAAAEVHRELGPEYSDAVVASFLEKVDREIAARVEARLAGVPQAEPAKSGSRRTLLTGMAIGVAVGGIPLLLLLVMQAGRGSQAVARTSTAGGNVTQVVVAHSSHSVGWFLLLLIVAAICAVATVRARQKKRAAGPL